MITYIQMGTTQLVWALHQGNFLSFGIDLTSSGREGRTALIGNIDVIVEGRIS
jgi:hypothetical protein